MIISIFGMVGSGKDTISDLLSKMMGLPRVKFTFKDLADKKGISHIEMQELASEAEDGKIDKEFDKHLVEEVNRLNKQEDGCIVSTWMGPWLTNPDITIFLDVSKDERINRMMERENKSYEEAKEYIEKREENNRKRYYEIYGIDIMDRSIFDITINSDNLEPQETAQKAFEAIKNKVK